LLAYVIDIMTGGMAAARKGRRSNFVRYQFPTLIATLGRTRRIRKEREDKLSALSEHLHCSNRKIMTEFLPYLQLI
jgi:hypothetical protein